MNNEEKILQMLTGLVAKVDGMEQGQNKLVQRFDLLEQGQNKLVQKVDLLEQGQRLLAGRQDEFAKGQRDLAEGQRDLAQRQSELTQQVDRIEQSVIRIENEHGTKIAALFDGYTLRGDQIEQLKSHLDERLDSIQNDLSYVVSKAAQHDRHIVQLRHQAR